MDYSMLTIYVLSFAVNSYVAAVVWRRRPHGWTGRLVVALWVVISAYLFTNYLSLNPPVYDLKTQLFWIRAVMFETSFIMPVVIALAATLPGREFGLKPWVMTSLLAYSLLCGVLAWTPVIFESLTYVQGIETPKPGPGIGLYVINLVGSYVLSMIVSVRRYRHAEFIDKPMHLYFIIGLTASYLFILTVSFITPLVFASSRTVFLGPVIWSVLFVFLHQMLSGSERPSPQP